ncbi:hypothetical protein GCM10010508_19390 [Streptomyces naganishii JCM 4654]|uniref:Uncharacterized protein n=1 Tax=Streptomyces naganishii JCM 4654 TaxID=1306179 RepID=A0A918Y1R1_9ACTN|nr:hypothetical protein GCM10010508_19390 [Streptomyces naganishii JCM 4654]
MDGCGASSVRLPPLPAAPEWPEFPQDVRDITTAPHAAAMAAARIAPLFRMASMIASRPRVPGPAPWRAVVAFVTRMAARGAWRGPGRCLLE